MDINLAKKIIEDSFDNQQMDQQVDEAVDYAIDKIDAGVLRIAEKVSHNWHINEWLKKAILLSFKIQDNKMIGENALKFYDKVQLKFTDYTAEQFSQEAIRVVPPATVRKGVYIADKVVLMPSYVNIGAYIDSGTMVDTWATVGSCAQIGKNVHLSGGVGIGGVLEPLQANPTIIEDECFIGARSEIVEGVIVEEGSVLSMGVYISQSTPIYNRHTKETIYGKVPAGSVVVPGSIPAKDGSHSLYAAIIVKTVDNQTRQKTAINELLRY